MPQHRAITLIEAESKISIDINDAIDFLECIIEQDYFSLFHSRNFVNKEAVQLLTSDDYKAVFSPPPE